VALPDGPAGVAFAAEEEPKADAATPAKTEIPKELIDAFIEKPNRENYLALHKKVVSHPDYNPYSRDLDEIEDLHEKGKFAEARKKIRESMPNLLLSPRAHLIAGMAAGKMNDDEAMRREGTFWIRCIDGILATGDGTEERPYLVTAVSDEYDVLRRLGKVSKSQGIQSHEGKHFDVIFCTDGSHIWFDITHAFNHIRKRFQKRDRKP